MSVKTSIVRVEVDGRQNRAGSLANEAHEPKKVLVIDIGRTSVKLLVSGQHKRRMLSSGRKMTADKVLEDLRGVGGTVMRTSFDHTKEAALRDALASHAAAEAATSGA